jgi:hypothetical protein
MNERVQNSPLGRVNSPLSSPAEMARLTWDLNMVSVRLETSLLALMYLVMA